MLRNICLITLSAFVLVFAAGSKTNPREHGGDGRGMSHELTGTITSHDRSNNSFVIDDKDTIYYNNQTVFHPEHAKDAILAVGAKVKVKYMNREGDKVAERVEMAAPENRRSSADKDKDKDTTKNKNKSATDDNKDNAKNKSKDGTKDKADKDKDGKKHEKGEPKTKERGKDRGAEPDSVPYPEHEGEGW
ncbi:MAG: DUF5666 domain-containing protein [Chitinispirillia bacterium]|nr:DUF5666 domain-containing protein [Chitinispirillia bacterium]